MSDSTFQRHPFAHQAAFYADLKNGARELCFSNDMSHIKRVDDIIEAKTKKLIEQVCLERSKNLIF
jgi:hypothetical protein